MCVNDKCRCKSVSHSLYSKRSQVRLLETSQSFELVSVTHEQRKNIFIDEIVGILDGCITVLDQSQEHGCCYMHHKTARASKCLFLLVEGLKIEALFII